jgi:bifunctional UDP-N-acetylglucosamine pyrophosphorylase/glucosamine-1-phosphate N-acetyltransferase
MKAVVLAAGLGTRMHPLTLTTPKFLLPLAGKPLLTHVFSLLKGSGIREVGVVVGHGKDRVIEEFGDGSELGLELKYFHQRKLLGTGDALKSADEFVSAEPFLVINGDVLVDQLSLNRVMEKYERVVSTKGFGGILSTAKGDDSTQFGVLSVKDGKVKDLLEKPRGKKSGPINAGVYVFTPEIFDVMKKVKKSKRGEYELTDAVELLLKEGKSIYASPLDWWIDIGRPWDLLVANEHLLKELKEENHGRVEAGASIHGPIYLGEGSMVRSGTYIEGPVYIGKNCDIGPNCYIRPFTSIGDGVRVGNGVEIKNSIIMGKTHIAHLSYVGDSVIGRNCNFGAGSIIANLRLDDGEVKMKIKTKTVGTGRRKLGAVIADGVKLGVNCTINPGVKIGPNSAVGPGALVSEDVLSGKLVLARPQVQKLKWPPG